MFEIRPRLADVRTETACAISNILRVAESRGDSNLKLIDRRTGSQMFVVSAGTFTKAGQCPAVVVHGAPLSNCRNNSFSVSFEIDFKTGELLSERGLIIFEPYSYDLAGELDLYDKCCARGQTFDGTIALKSVLAEAVSQRIISPPAFDMRLLERAFQTTVKEEPSGTFLPAYAYEADKFFNRM